VRIGAAYALGYIGDMRSFNALFAAQIDKDYRVRISAIYALQRAYLKHFRSFISSIFSIFSRSILRWLLTP